MERQSTSKFFRILIAIAAFFILCSSSILFASCGTSTIGVKDHEHQMNYDKPALTTTGNCGTPGSVTYKCSDEECTYSETVITDLPSGSHEFENGYCKKCGMTESLAGAVKDLVTKQELTEKFTELQSTLDGLAKSADLSALLTEAQVKTLIEGALGTTKVDLNARLSAIDAAIVKAVTDLAGKSGTTLESVQTAITDALDGALESIMGETGLAGFGRQLAGISELLEEVDTASIDTYLKETLAAKIDDIKTTLGSADSGLVKDIKDLAQQITDLSIPTADAISAKVKEVLGTDLDGIKTSLEGVLTSEAFTAKVTELQSAIEGKLDALQSAIEEKIEALQSGIITALQESQIGTSITGIDEAVQEIKKALGVVDAAADAPAGTPSYEGQAAEKPEGLIQQVSDLWDKVEALQTAVATMDTTHSQKLDEMKQDAQTKYDQLSADIKAIDKALNGEGGKGGLIAELQAISDQITDITDKLAWVLDRSGKMEKLMQLAEDLYAQYGKYLTSDYLDVLARFADFAKDNIGKLDKVEATIYAFHNFLGNGDGQNPAMTLTELKSTLEGITESLKNPVVDSDGAHHVHNWVLTLAESKDGSWVAKEDQTPACLTSNTYIWQCSICDAIQKKEGKDEVATFTALATGHVLDWTAGRTDMNHHYEPTCIAPGRVEAKCVNCGEWVGQWTDYGAPTGKHNYQLDETDVQIPDPSNPFVTNTHKCDSVHPQVYHCATCGGAYVLEVTVDGSLGPDGQITFHDYYSQLDGEGKPTGKAMTDEEKLEAYNKYAGNTEENEWKTLKDVTLSPQQKYEALKDNLNIVFQDTRTCVDPGLVVVECVHCGVRYAYSYGEPSKHDLQLVDAGQEYTCTTDGVTPYYYCKKCGYYFQFEKDGKPFNVPDEDIHGDSALDIYLFSTNYLRTEGKTGTVINSKDKDAAQLAYDACARKAYGHTFAGNTYSIDADCGWADRSFDICTECGEIVDHHAVLKNDKGYGKEDPHTYTWNPKLYKEEDDGTYYAGDPDFITNLKALGLEGAIAKLTELGYFTFIVPSDLKEGATTIEDLCEGKDEAEKLESLIKFAVTGWNVSPMYINSYKDNEFKPHTYVPVFVGDPTCLTAQDYILVCSKCFKYDEKTFADCFKLAEDGDHYVIKEDAEIDASQIVAKAQTIEENSELAKSWANLEKTAKSAADYAAWYANYGYLVRSAEDDETEFDAEAYIAGLDIAKDLDEIKSFYGEGKNAIDTQLQLPVQGHQFKEHYVTVIADCVMYERRVHVCDVCGTSVVSYVDGDEGVSPATITPVKDEETVAKNDLTAEWEAVYAEGKGAVEDIIVWLANHGYFNAERELLGETLYVEGVFQTIEQGDEIYTKLVEFLGETAKNAEELATYFTGTNVTKELTIKQYLLENGALGSIILGHTFTAVHVESANCEEGGAYVYVCTKCGGTTEGTLSYTVLISEEEGDKTIETGIPLITKDTPLTDLDLFHKDAPATRHEELEMTDLAREFFAIDDLDDMLDWLLVKGYLNTISDTLAGVGSKTYDPATRPEIAAEKVFDEVKKLAAFSEEEEAKVTLTEFFTQTNRTLSKIGTSVPTMNHLWSYTAKQECVAYVDETLTEIYKSHHFAIWNAEKGEWTASEETFDPEDLDEDFRTNADLYGILGACKRENCPQHDPDYLTTHIDDETKYPFNAGFKAATDHQMVYFKYAALEDGTPSSTALEEEGGSRVEYNMKDWEDYEGADEAAKKSAWANDEHNLYVLDAIYSGTYAEQFGAMGGELDPETVMPETARWDPLTKVDTPSCWLSLRCRWFGEEVNGHKCTKRDPDTPHTLPQPGDEGYDRKKANCQHGDLCTVCGHDMNSANGKHNLIDIQSILAEDGENHTAELVAALEKVKADVQASEDDWWVDPLEPTCCETGLKLYICVGELQVYLEPETEIIWANGINYRIDEVGKTPHGYDDLAHPNFETRYFDLSTNKPIDMDHLEKPICQQGYYKVDYCMNLNRAGEVCACKPDCVRIQVKPTQEAWDEEDYDWKQWYTDAQIEALGDIKPATVPDYVPKYGELAKAGRDGSFGSTKSWTDSYGHYDLTKAPGHTFAPVEEYWLLGDGVTPNGRYLFATEEHNAWITHVCIVCGESMQGYYGENLREDGDTMYIIATEKQINEYNEKGAEFGRAQPFRKDDRKKTPGTEGEATNGIVWESGRYDYKEDSEVVLPEGETEYKLYTRDTLVVLGDGVTLTMSASTGTEKGFMNLWGTDLVIRGEGAGKSTLDLTALGYAEGDGSYPAMLLDNNSVLTLEGLTVLLGEDVNSVLFATGSRKVGGGKIIIKDCEVIKKVGGAPIQTSQANDCRNVSFEIVNSKIVSGDDTALFLTEPTATVTATDSIFFGKNMGAYIRGGTATFERCTFVTESGASYSGAFSSGTNVPVSAALVVGNHQDTANKRYGDANVTLTACAFKLGAMEDLELATVALTEEFSGTDYTIAVFASKENKSTVTLDKETSALVKETLHKDGELGNIEVVLRLESVTATEAATFIKDVAATGGTIVLPEGLGTVTLDGQFRIESGETLTLDLGDNTLELVKGEGSAPAVKGTLVIENGTVTTDDQFSVQEGGSLTLINVELTAAGETNKGWLLAAPKGDATIRIENSKISTASTTAGIAFNNAESGKVTIYIIDSEIRCDCDDGDGRIALLVNKSDAEVYAGGSTFYGANAAAWIRGGTATFEGCTFYGGNVESKYEKTETGGNISKTHCAAVVVGDDTGYYGDADVTIQDCTVSLYEIEGSEAAKGNGKLFTIIANGKHTSTVKFSDEDTAKAFIKDLALTVGENLFLEGTATLGNVNVSYGDKDPVAIAPIVNLTKEELADKAADTIQDAAANGGKIVLPEGEETVTVDESVAITDSLTIDLNGNTLEVPETVDGGAGLVSGLIAYGDLALSNGTVTGSIAMTEEANVTLDHVVLDHSGYDTNKTETYFGILLSGESAEAGASLTLKNTYVKAVQPLYVNGSTDGATITLENSDFIGENGHGLWIAGDVKMTAKNCNFYGSVYAVQICAGDVTFENCAFMSTNDTFSSSSEAFMYGGAGMPDSTFAPLVINAKGTTHGYGMASVTVRSNCDFYNISAPGKWKPEDVFTTPEGSTDGLKLIKSRATGETMGYVKLSEEKLNDVTLAYVKDQSGEEKLTFSVVGGTLTDVVVSAFLFQLDGAASGEAKVTKVTDWQLGDYFEVTGCTATQVTE